MSQPTIVNNAVRVGDPELLDDFLKADDVAPTQPSCSPIVRTPDELINPPDGGSSGIVHPPQQISQQLMPPAKPTVWFPTMAPTAPAQPLVLPPSMPPQPQSISGPVGLSDSESYYELPGFDTMSETWQNDIVLPKELVSGLIHMGTKTALVGGSKANKTWSLMDLGLSIAYGMPWWGLPTHQGRVLYINFEIPPPFARKRLRMIELAKKPTDNRHRADFVLWNLRGHAAYFALRIDQIAQQIAQGNFAAVIVDPVYKLLGARDENSARDVAQMLNSLEQLLAKSDAALIFGAHTTKGNQAQKEAMDRASGSGVFARDPDTMIILTSHLEPDAFTVDFVLRNFPPKPPFVVRREHPLMVRAADLDPEDLKQARTGQRARKPTPTVEMFLSIFPTKAIGDVVKSSLGNADISRVFKERDWDSGSIKTLKDQASTMGHLVMKPQAHNHQRFILAEVLQVLEAA